MIHHNGYGSERNRKCWKFYIKLYGKRDVKFYNPCISAFFREKNHVMEFQHLNFYITLDFPKADTYQNNKKSL